MNRVQMAVCWGCAVVLRTSVLCSHAGTLETLDHQKFEGAVSLTEDGRLDIAMEDGQRKQFPLDAVSVARLQTARFDSDSLPKGWHAEDIGEVRGSTAEWDNQLSVKVSGKTAKDSKSQAVHYAFRIVRGDGGIVGKLDAADNQGKSVAGVMLRENLEPSGGFVLLGVTADKKIQLTWRETAGATVKAEEFGRAEFPLWLKLARNQDKDKIVIGWRSEDGVHWQRAGQAKLSTRIEPWPPGAVHKKPLLYVGTAVTGPGEALSSTAKFGAYVVSAKGLLGEYYADDNFKELKFTRAETKLEMNWDHKSPAPEISPERFSARWTGQVEPRYSERFRIYVDGNEETQIWLNGEKLRRVSRTAKPAEASGNEVSFEAGRKYDIRIDFKKGEKPSPMRLGWSSASQAFEWIPAHQLSYTYSSKSPNEESIASALVPKGIWLRNGSFLAGDLISSDGSSSLIKFGHVKELAVFNQKIAYVLFRSCRRAMPLEAIGNKTGLLLSNGDFLESELEGLKERKLRLTSVLFGQRSFSLDQPEPLALVLNKTMPDDTTSEIALLNGSILRAKSLRKNGNKWLVNDSALGQMDIPEDEIVEIRNKRSLVASRSESTDKPH
ncbi:MAG: Na-Ca exchanger/integrin-beta4 [Verrucomicrobiales bacterium]|nr:Na-Ca exchanger/integrin-beta4 [Verrucomicrobiales bacterium]